MYCLHQTRQNNQKDLKVIIIAQYLLKVILFNSILLFILLPLDLIIFWIFKKIYLMTDINFLL